MTSDVIYRVVLNNRRLILKIFGFKDEKILLLIDLPQEIIFATAATFCDIISLIKVSMRCNENLNKNTVFEGIGEADLARLLSTVSSGSVFVGRTGLAWTGGLGFTTEVYSGISFSGSW